MRKPTARQFKAGGLCCIARSMTDELSNPMVFRDGPLRSFGRVRGRKLSPKQQALLDDLLPGISIDAPGDGLLDPRQLMPDATEIHFEIGFGGGEHVAGSAARWPHVLHIGAEPFEEGLAKLLGAVEAQRLKNVRIIAGDARPVLNTLTPASIDRLVILFPDPWQKARHAKRRLIQQAFLDSARRALKPGAEMRFATDWADYADHALRVINAHDGFEWMAEASDDWRLPPADHITTRYETKGLGDCPPVFLRFVAG
jgi:tRNA (guanine-N7-)-methyltransferase